MKLEIKASQSARDREFKYSTTS